MCVHDACETDLQSDTVLNVKFLFQQPRARDHIDVRSRPGVHGIKRGLRAMLRGGRTNTAHGPVHGGGVVLVGKERYSVLLSLVHILYSTHFLLHVVVELYID